MFLCCLCNFHKYVPQNWPGNFFLCITTKAHLTSDSSVLSMFKKRAQTFLLYTISCTRFIWSCPICNLIVSSGSLYLHCLCMCASICRKYGWSEVAFTCIVYVCVLLYVGSMDEVNQEVNITWVQPRVLGLNQVCVLSLFCFLFFMSLTKHNK